jgi:type III secretion protein R
MRPDELLSKPIVLVLVLAITSLLPFLFMSVTAFVKISTVFQITKSAIGAQSVPSNTVIMALSSCLTLLAMAPVTDRIIERATPIFQETAKEGKGDPKSQDTTTLVTKGIEAAREPMRDFLKNNASELERSRFLELARSARPEAERTKVTEDDLTVLAPAFVVSELTEAFQLGFLIYLPFLIIDLVIANVLLALGMQSLNPTQVSLPFKLLLFVGMGGFGILAQALIAGYKH